MEAAMDMDPRSRMGADDIHLGDVDFWSLQREQREQAFATLRRERPVSFHEEPEVPLIGKGPGFWAVTRHADILEVTRNPQTFSSAAAYGGVNMVDQPASFSELFGSMIVMDDPRHARLRRIVSRAFGPGILRQVEASIQRAAAEIVDGVIGAGGCDFVTDIAAALPLKIICGMMGIPSDSYRYVFDRTNVILGASDPEYVADLADAAPAMLQAAQELAVLAEELVRSRQDRPAEDLTSALVQAEVDGERLAPSEIASFFLLLVLAGNETTRHAISHGMKALHDHPEQRRIWAEDFEAVAPTAVEEIVRWATPVIHFRRTATRDAEIGGQRIREGEKVVMWYNSGNRDEAAFEDPYRFDVRRTPNEHVGFGGPGPHFCLGAHLARREMTVMFRELFRRLPELTIAGEPAYLASLFFNGIKHMRCELGPRARAGGSLRG
jgi:cytochrome P450